MAMIADNLAKIRENIATVCRRCERNPENITLVGISKYADAPQIEEAIAAGLTHIGENRVQEASLKFDQVPSIHKVARHMVGHLQTNKVKSAVEMFDLIESVDSIRLVREVQKCADKLDRSVNILAQVNIAGEEQKFGLDQQELPAFLETVESDCPRIRLKGLMTIAPLTEEKDIIHKCFCGLRELAIDMSNSFDRSDRISFDVLSMGMSADYDIAIVEGATMIRIGRAIFHGS